MATQIEELEATVRELQALHAAASAESRALLASQIEATQQTIALLRSTAPHDNVGRPPLAPEVATFFTPEPAAEVPAWLADSATRADIVDATLRCPDGARVYFEAKSAGCAIPGVPGKTLSVAHGLSLQFRSDGRLADQSFYDHGLIRWSITYHATGGRDHVGFYVSTEPKTYVEDGLHTRYSSNGTVVSQATWRAGTQHGWDKKWEADGYPIGATRFENGHAVERVLADGTKL